MGAQVGGVLWSGATHGWEPIPAPRETPMSVSTRQVLLVSAHVVGGWYSRTCWTPATSQRATCRA